MLIPGQPVSRNPMLAGGEEEAHAALEEGLNAILNLQLEHHCHLQPYLSSSDGTAKWAKIEMWPMMVCLFKWNVHSGNCFGFTVAIATAINGHACMRQKHLSAELLCTESLVHVPLWLPHFDAFLGCAVGLAMWQT